MTDALGLADELTPSAVINVIAAYAAIPTTGG